MATKLEMWRSEAGNHFANEHEAHRDDLVSTLAATGSINVGSATTAAKKLTADKDALATLHSLIGRLLETHPAQNVGKPHDVEPPAVEAVKAATMPEIRDMPRMDDIVKPSPEVTPIGKDAY